MLLHGFVKLVQLNPISHLTANLAVVEHNKSANKTSCQMSDDLYKHKEKQIIIETNQEKISFPLRRFLHQYCIVFIFSLVYSLMCSLKMRKYFDSNSEFLHTLFPQLNRQFSSSSSPFFSLCAMIIINHRIFIRNANTYYDTHSTAPYFFILSFIVIQKQKLKLT